MGDAEPRGAQERQCVAEVIRLEPAVEAVGEEDDLGALVIRIGAEGPRAPARQGAIRGEAGEALREAGGAGQTVARIGEPGRARGEGRVAGQVGGFLTRAQIPQELAAGLLDLTENRWAILAILNVFFLVIGFFLHSAAAIILVVPIVVPLIDQVGIDPVHFGLIVTLNLAIGQQTPPVASVLITACSIARANIWDVSRTNIGFVAVLLFVLMLCTYVEPIPMFLVELIYR